MNREDIIRMAREQGLPETETEGVFRVNSDDLGRLLAAEREACAKVCTKAIDSIWEYSDAQVKETGRNVCTNLAAAILARGQA